MLLRGASTLAIVTALLVGTLVPLPAANAEAAVETASQEPESPAARAARTEPAPEYNGKKRRHPPLSVAVHQRIHGRADGYGVVDVTMARSPHQRNRKVRKASVVVYGPKGTRVVKARTIVPREARWRCRRITQKLPALGQPAPTTQAATTTPAAEVTPAATLDASKKQRVRKVRTHALRCAWPKAVGPQKVPARLRAWVATGARHGGKEVPIQAVASWKSQGGRSHRMGGRGLLNVDKKLKVRLNAGDHTVHYFGDRRSERTGVVTARLKNHGNRDVTVAWEQIGGPRVKMLPATSGVQAKEISSQRFVLPRKAKDGDTVRFRVTGRSNGQWSRSVDAVRVIRHETTRYQPSFDGVRQMMKVKARGQVRGFASAATGAVEGVDLPCTNGNGGSCQLFPPNSTMNVALTDVTQSEGGFSSSVTVFSGDADCVLTGNGQYTSSSEWSLRLTQPVPCGIGQMTVRGMTGTVTAKPTADGKAQILVDIGGGTVTGAPQIDLIDVTRGGLSITITNGCAPNQANCIPADLNMGLQVAGSVTFRGTTSDVTLIAPIDLSTGEVGTVKVDAQFPQFTGFNLGMGLGFDVKASTIWLTRAEDAGACAPASDPVPDPTGDSLVLTVNATVEERTVNPADPTSNKLLSGWPLSTDDSLLRGNINADGFCTWFKFGDAKFMNLWEFSDVVVGYTSYEGGARVRLPDQVDGGRTIALKQGLGIHLDGKISLAVLASGLSFMNDLFSPFLDEEIPFSADYDAGSGFTIRTGVAPSQPKRMMGNVQEGNPDYVTNTGLTWNGLEFILSVNYENYTGGIAIQADSTLIEPMKPGTPCSLVDQTPTDACSYTPLAGTFEVDMTNHAAPQRQHGWFYYQTNFAVSLSVNTDPDSWVNPKLGRCPGIVYKPSAASMRLEPMDPQPQCAKDAFGVAGLDIARAGVGMTLSFNSPWTEGHLAYKPAEYPPDFSPPPIQFQVQFDAAAFLPDDWTKNVALINKPLVELGLSLSLGVSTDPTSALAGSCMYFSVGEENTDPSKPAVQYFDVANAGVMTGSYFYVVYAPTGCTFNIGAKPQTINPGYSVGFDGQVFGEAITGSLEVQMPSGTENLSPENDFHAQGTLEAAALSYYGVSMEELSFYVDVWEGPYPMKSQAQFSGGLGLGWAHLLDADVEISGDIEIGKAVEVTQNGYTTISPQFTMILGGDGSVEYAGGWLGGSMHGGVCPTNQPFWQEIPVNRRPTNCIVSINVTAVNRYVGVDATMTTELLGSTLTWGAGLIFADGRLMDLHAQIGARLNLFVGQVGGAVFFDYCYGTLSVNDKGETGVKDCDYTTSAPVTRLNLGFADGNYTLGWCPICYSKDFGPYTIYSAFIKNDTGQPGGDDKPALNADLNLKIPAGFNQLNAADYDLPIVLGNADTLATGNFASRSVAYAIKAVIPQEFTADIGPLPACTQPSTGVQWTPTNADPNPVASNVPPVPDGSEACGIRAVYTKLIGDVPKSQQQAQSLLRDPAQWESPQMGWVACGFTDRLRAPDGACVLFDSSGRNLSTVAMGQSYLSPRDDVSTNAAGVLSQLYYGLTHPIGVVLGGMQVDPAHQIWSPDGGTVLTGSDSGQWRLQRASNAVAEPDNPYWTAGGYGPGAGPSPLGLRQDGVIVTNSWQSPEPTTPSAKSPYLQVSDGGLWVRNPDNLTQPMFRSTPPGDSFRLRSGTNPDLCLTSKGWYPPLDDPSLQPCGSSPTQVLNYTESTEHPGSGKIGFSSRGLCYVFDAPSGRPAPWVLEHYDCTPNRLQDPNGWLWSFPGSGEIKNLTRDGICVDVSNAGSTAGTPVQTYPCNGSKAQQWTIESLPDDFLAGPFKLQSALNPDLCLLGGGGPNRLQPCDFSDGESLTATGGGGPSQLEFADGSCLNAKDFGPTTVTNCTFPGNGWSYRSGTVQGSAKDNMCLDVTDGVGKAGTVVQTFGCNGTVSQQWIMLPVGGMSVSTDAPTPLDDGPKKDEPKKKGKRNGTGKKDRTRA